MSLITCVVCLLILFFIAVCDFNLNLLVLLAVFELVIANRLLPLVLDLLLFTVTFIVL
jgi:hypothetical protein